MRSSVVAIVGCLAVACGGHGSAGDGPLDGAASDAQTDARGPLVEAGADAHGSPVDGGADTSVPSGQDAGGDAPGATLDAPADAPDAGPPQAVGLPMYVDPTSSPALWTQANASAPTVALLIANPDSGPGAAVDPQYTQAIAAAHAAGQTIIGYIHTSSAGRAIADVEADIDSCYSFYPAIDGVFSDETAEDPSTVASYYVPLYQYVKAKSGAHVVVLNPGTMIDESFMTAGDVVVTFEDVYANYTAGAYASDPAWVATYPRWRFWHLVLSASTTADMQDAVTLSRQRNVGYVYVTDQPPATAYQELVTGAYWQAELAAVTAP